MSLELSLRSTRSVAALTVWLAAATTFGQGEAFERIHSAPRQNVEHPQGLRDGVKRHFVYSYLPQTLPIIDDFSVDRTRKRGAAAGDPDVSLTATHYALTVAGVSLPDMAYRTDTSWHYTVDISDAGTVVTKVALPVVEVQLVNVSAWPVGAAQTVNGWPLYHRRDTVGGGSGELPLTPQLVQDSLLEYLVAADTRQYINPDNSPRPWVLWEEDDVYINGGFPIAPPTVGVATFDGCDRTGYPYRPDAPNTQGRADHMTSVPINLQYPPGDSIYLSFFFQSLGRSGDNASTILDSLLLEFYAPEQDRWTKVWGVLQQAVAPFQQVMIPIVDHNWLRNGFRMRFVNVATLGGPVDQFHVDYVRLGRNRGHADRSLDDVAFIYPEQSLLLRYTAVPYAKYLANPAGFMAQRASAEQRNNWTADKLITWGGYSTPVAGGASGALGGGTNVSNNAVTTYNASFAVAESPASFAFPTESGETDAEHRVKLWLQATPDGNRYNDTITFVQHFSNYYAYDDGTAEWAYTITGTENAKRLAYRFDSPGGDMLTGLRMYFAPLFSYNTTSPSNPRNAIFLLTVWSALEPEEIIYQNISFHMPQYVTWGPNTFAEYRFDEPVAVDGPFYVGLVMTNSESLGLGLDANRVNNDRMYYNAGTGWSLSTAPGSWMIRPVVEAASDPWAGVPEIGRSTSLLPWPNPSASSFRVGGYDQQPGDRLVMRDALGRQVRTWDTRIGEFAVDGLAPGAYLLQLTDAAGNAKASGRLIVDTQ